LNRTKEDYDQFLKYFLLKKFPKKKKSYKKMGKFWKFSFPSVNLNIFSILLAKFIILQFFKNNLNPNLIRQGPSTFVRFSKFEKFFNAKVRHNFEALSWF
jgi:hypothetical protein